MSKEKHVINYWEDTSYFWGSAPDSRPSWGDVNDDDPSTLPQEQRPLVVEGPAPLIDQPTPEEPRAE